jgi:hypothetical protein
VAEASCNPQRRYPKQDEEQRYRNHPRFPCPRRGPQVNPFGQRSVKAASSSQQYVCRHRFCFLFQFLAIGRLTLGLLHNDAFCSIESHWFLGPGSADDENDLDAIKEVKDVDSAKEANDGDKKADTKLEITATHRRWRPFGSAGFFAGVAQPGIDADKK